MAVGAAVPTTRCRGMQVACKLCTHIVHAMAHAQAAAAKIAEAMPCVDVLINNAGWLSSGTLVP